MGRARRPVRLQLTGRRPLIRAERLIGDGRAAEAARLMVKTYLRGHNPQTAAPDEDRIDAVGWYVQAIDADPAAVPDPLAWSRWARTAAHRLHAAHPDLDLLQSTVDTLNHALLRAGQHEEAILVRRESIQIAAARRDTAGAQKRHAYLASDLHAIGRCDEAADEGLTALEPIFAADPPATLHDISAAVGIFMSLESCHRHDAATQLAARLGRHPIGLALAATFAFEPENDDLLTVLSPAFQTHTAQHHHGEPCAQQDCPLAHDGAVGVRFYSAALSGYHPATADPDVALIRVASRFVLFPDTDQQDTADTAAWAEYAHRATLTHPASSTEDITVATKLALAVADRHVDRQAGIDASRAAVTALTGRADVGAVTNARLELAQRLHRAGRCDDALAEAAAALTAYDAVSTSRDATGVTHYFTVAAMFDGCHRHDDIDTLGLSAPFDGAYFNDQPDVVTDWLVTFEESRLSMLEHARTFHADTSCAHEECAKRLTAAADIPHQRALHHILYLYEAHRFDDAVAATRQHLARHDPETSPPSQGLAQIALCHLTNAVEHFPDQRDETVLPWGRYARRAADVLDPDRGNGWAALTSMFVRAATLYGAYTEAIEAAAEASEHCTDRGDIPATLTAQFEYANTVHAAGHCAEARQHATAAWHDTLEHLDPADPDQRLTGLLAGINLMHLLGDCHQHEDAAATFARAVTTYGTHNTNPEADADAREQRWQRANRDLIHRSDHHRTTYHATDPCRDQHEHIDVPIAVAISGIPAHTADFAAFAAVQDTP
ncbi:hypothetical protein [Dactylosporangium sp. NPDC050588]|uniref:hypothetical protein n=1 Tax=Dactylosporangium sp. NPDC050588 TaxID=3157211 RepID=UPI0033C66790